MEDRVQYQFEFRSLASTVALASIHQRRISSSYYASLNSDALTVEELNCKRHAFREKTLLSLSKCIAF